MLYPDVGTSLPSHSLTQPAPMSTDPGSTKAIETSKTWLRVSPFITQILPRPQIFFLLVSFGPLRFTEVNLSPRFFSYPKSLSSALPPLLQALRVHQGDKQHHLSAFIF